MKRLIRASLIACAVLITGSVVGQAEASLRIGYVGPVKTGSASVTAAIYDFVGDAARNGVRLADDVIDARWRSGGVHVEVLFASTPSAEAARRAAERLVLVEGVDALVGGLGDGQANVLAEVAETYDVLFMNIGSSSLALRRICRPTVFHVEPSAAMYLDGWVDWHVEQGDTRWFVVYEDDEEGRLRRRRAEVAVERRASSGAVVVGSAAVRADQPVYATEFQLAVDADADVVLLIANAVDQVAFMAQLDSFRHPLTVVPYPTAPSQSREYMSAAARFAGEPAHVRRIASWETTLEDGGAADLNDRYTSRFGQPMEPHAWTAYAAIMILYEAASSLDTLDVHVVGPFLEDDETAFQLQKGVPLSFRSGDHQLRQPLYVTAYEPTSVWGQQLTQQVAVASLEGRVPDGDRGSMPVTAWLDQLGDAKASVTEPCH